MAREALESIVTWFDDISKHQFEQLGQGIDKACEEWPNLYQGYFDMNKSREALSKIRGNNENR